ncbi:hypothetical protein MCOR34_004770 [Pyricularia oryzae]|uniref:ATP-dependent Clp protease proteolytic subunit n=1 Tax=Pyricularia oryzae TaxID=318829 RepID=A0A4P7N2G9_PYROR|nr:hypothetical protein MCOR34_004770 [Pyricularia oryzae]KAI6573977.1 hypothetical protein MCOR04_007287 [Pyricularia oryzae]QBZ54070.1 hypothetical protein PoMZ_09761 [Pyricularia oryzae]
MNIPRIFRHTLTRGAPSVSRVAACQWASLNLSNARSFSHSRPPQAGVPMPLVTEVTAGGWRTSDIFSKLLQERIVCLNGPIDDWTQASVTAQLLWLEQDSPHKPITLYINSPGGQVSSGLAIYDTMNYISSPVHTVCVGMAASMGAILLLGGAAGQRYALPHSQIMVHQPLGSTQGQASDIIIYAKQITRIRSQINDIMRRHLNTAAGRERFAAQEVDEMMERDKYLTADEAVELGIVDKILTSRSDAVASALNDATGGRSAAAPAEAQDEKKN